MMRIILLLLVTLTGPFCTFTKASTLVVPTTGSTQVPDFASTRPAFAEKTEEPALQDTISTSKPAPEATEVAASTEEAPVLSTTEQVIQAEAPKTAAPTDTAKSTEAATEQTEGPDDTAVIPETTAEGTQNAGVTESQGVDVEDEGMSTGQLVGIVIGALITVIIVIAVIILVVRRMGQYSP